MIQKTSFSHFSDYLFINLMNTLKMQNHSPIDLLTEEENAAQWLTLMEDNGLLMESQIEQIKKAPIQVDDLRQFRNQCRDHFASNDSHDKLIHLLTNATKAAPLSFIIQKENLTPLPSEGGTQGLLAIIAFQVLQFEGAGLLNKVKACENDDCLAFFIDQKGKRKWCSMEVCGNRKKAKKHYYTKTKASNNT